MTEKISEWKLAKELCESIKADSIEEKVKQINQSDTVDSIKQKALNLISKMEDDFDLLESKQIEKIFKANQEKPNLIGKKIDDYELLSLLGAGGMSSVYLAKRTQSDIQKLVALKILSPYATDDKYLELFNREQKSLSQLNHKSIVSFHHGGQTEDGTKYLIMDYVEEAKDIVSYVEDNELDRSQRIKLIKDIAEAMSYAHSKGIVHRDLKSANILVDSNGTLKIVDFGISLFADTNQTISDESTRCFTLDIASPEQIQGKKVDARTDVFSLGALLLQLLTDKTPLPKVKISQYRPIDDKRYIDALLKESVLPKDLRNIVSTAMHIDLDIRYKDMSSFEEDLDSYLNHRPVNATSDSVLYKSTKLVQRNPLVSLLIASVVIVLLVAFFLVSDYQFKSQKAEDKNISTMAIIDALFEQANPFKSGKSSKELVKALESIEQGQSNLLNSDPEFAYHFYQNMAEIYGQNANYVEALKSKRKAITALKLFVEANDPQIIKRELDESRLMHATGDYAQAIIKSQDLLSKLSSTPDSDPELILTAYLTLSRSYGSLNKLNDETKIHNLTMKLMDENPGLNAERKTDVLSSMAISQYRNGNKEMANELFERTISVYKTLPNRHKSLASTLRNYAATQVNYGDYEKAEKLFKESIDVIKSMDPRHPTLASTYLRYASLLAKSNRLDKAEELLNTAVDIFIEAQDDVELSIAYGYLAELALRKNRIDEAIKHILSASKYMFNQQGLDHPKTLKKYNIALWILLMEPYQQYAEEVIEFLDATDYLNSIHSKEFQILQIQKAFLDHDIVSNKQDVSIISEYLYSETLISNSQKLSWLELQIKESENYSALSKAFLNVWLLEIKPDKLKYEGVCINSNNWIDTTKLVLKMDLMSRCLSVAEINKFDEPIKFRQILNDLEQQISNNKQTIEKLVDELIHVK
jgi:serine/threonine-protein kinase